MKKKAAKDGKPGMRILIANGVNLDLLGTREKEIYGSFKLKDLEEFLEAEALPLASQFSLSKLTLDFFQTNDETEFLEKISEGSWDGLVLNPGAWTHTSVALRDRLAALSLAYVEVHISNLSAREEFRKTSYTAAHAEGVVYGFGKNSYVIGLFGLLKHLTKS